MSTVPLLPDPVSGLDVFSDPQKLCMYVCNGRNGSRLELKCSYCVLYRCYHYCKDGICYTIVKSYHIDYASSLGVILAYL